MSEDTLIDPLNGLAEVLEGKALISLEEAARLIGRDVRTVRRWAGLWIDSGGEHGIPVVQVTERLRLVPVPRLLAWLGSERSAGAESIESPASGEHIPERCPCVFSWNARKGG